MENFKTLEDTPSNKVLIRFLSIFLIVFSQSIYLYKLTDYPFYSIHDELRDGGLQAMQFATGQLINMFSYGFNGSHGLIIPFINSLFFHIFGSSYLTYRLPAAIISSLSILSVFLLFKRNIGVWQAFFSAIFLCLMIHHIYYARTEVVVAWSTLIGVFVFYFVTDSVTNKSIKSLYLLSLFAGISFSFHAGVRMTSIISLILVIIYFINLRNIKFSNLIQISLVFLIGLGPRIIYTTYAVLLPRQRIIGLVENSIFEATSNYILKIANFYRDSLLIFFIHPTAGWFPGHPMLSEISGWFLVLGVTYGLYKRNLYVVFGTLIILLTALTNDAITSSRLLEHRYAGCFPILALFVIEGGFVLGRLFKNKQIKLILCLICLSAILTSETSRAFKFFVHEQATAKFGADVINNYYLLTYFKNDMYKTKESSSNLEVCIIMNEDKLKFFNLFHVKEYFIYFFPKNKFDYMVDGGLNSSSLGYFFGSCPKSLSGALYHANYYCKERLPYVCPRTGASFEIRHVIKEAVK